MYHIISSTMVWFSEMLIGDFSGLMISLVLKTVKRLRRNGTLESTPSLGILMIKSWMLLNLFPHIVR